MVFILMLAAIVMQLFQREDLQIHLWALIAPFLFVALPFMAFIAALAVLFEASMAARKFRQHRLFLPLHHGYHHHRHPARRELAPVRLAGLRHLQSQHGRRRQSRIPTYAGGLSLSMVPASADIQPFTWTGITADFPIVLIRMLLFVWSIGLVLIAALFFDRFDFSRVNSSPRRNPPQTHPSLPLFP